MWLEWAENCPGVFLFCHVGYVQWNMISYIVSDGQEWSDQHFLNRDSRFHDLFIMKWKHHELLANTTPWDVQVLHYSRPWASECNRINDVVGSFCHFNWSTGFCPSTVSIEIIRRGTNVRLEVDSARIVFIYIYIFFPYIHYDIYRYILSYMYIMEIGTNPQM